MIYRVVLDDTMDLHTSDINCMLLNPSLDLEMNSAGSFNFTLPPSHPYWDAIKVLKSTIDVYEDGDLIFTGRIASIEKNWNNERVVQCEGALAYFNDSVHRQMKWETPLPIASEDPTVHNFLKDILDNHNVFEGAENANRHIFIGNITVDPEVVTREVNYDTTLDILTRMCIDTNGGYMSVRKDLDDGKLYLDWIKDFTEESGQPAQFGLNLLNFDTSLAAEDICTGVLARGAEVNEQTVMLNDVELVDETTYPDMSVTHYTTKYQDILWHREGVAKFGQVVQVHDFSDAQTAWKDGQGQIVANSLFEMAKKWLEEKNTKIETIEVEVAELAWLGEGMPKYKLGQIVELSDNVHMADESYETRLLPMYKLSCDLNSGSKKVTLGTPPKKELTQISASNSDSGTLSSSGSSSGGGGSGEGEECRVHDVKVNGTSVVTDKIANITVPTDTVTQSQMTQAINTAVSPKANTADVNQALALKQDNLVFNSQDAATAHLTKIKNGNDVYDIPTGTEVEANPTGAATSDLTKLKVGSDIYGIPSGGTSVVANPSGTPTDDLETIQIGSTVYDIPGGGSNTNYGKFKCDVLFVNTNGALPELSSTLFATLSKSISDYDALFIETSLYYNDNFHQAKPLIIFKQDYNFATSDELQFVQDFSAGSSDYRLFIKLYDETHIYANRTTNSGGGGSAMTIAKVYGLKFENKLINRSDIYSEEERMIGRWTDGKPLYQKVIDCGYGPNSSVKEINITALNIDNCIQIGGYMCYNSFSFLPIPRVSDKYIEDQLAFNYDNSTKVLRITCRDRDMSSMHIMAILKYTKTTDQPGSGVIPEDPMFISDPMIYSEEEQVVGSWTDGKPLYQKSFVLENPITIVAANTWTDTGIQKPSNIDLIVDAEVYRQNHLGSIFVSANAKDIEHITLQCSIAYTLNAGSIITIRYTKTTDSILSGPKKGKIVQRSDIYSEEERLIGRWTDGKPLYQKTLTVTTPSQYGQATNVKNVTDYSIDTCLDISGYIGNVPLNWEYDTNYNSCWINSAKNGIIMVVDNNMINKQAVITLQYTKTTDLPFSKQLIEDPQFVMMSDIYSEEEQVVGRWTDGKPLYQRTGSIIYTANTPDWTLVNNLDNYDYLVSSYGTFYEINGTNKDYIPHYGGRSSEPRLCVRKDHKLYHYYNSYAGNNRTFVYDYTIQYTKTTDAPGTGPTKGNLIYLPALYSEEEREVGVWTDGRPLYQKTIDCGTMPNRTTKNVAHGISNIDLNNMSEIKGVIRHSTSGYSISLPKVSDNSTNVQLFFEVTDTNIVIYARNNDMSLFTGKVTIQYTKTTDQPGSATWTPEGQLAHHYSTSEKIVGTWIDGSTVYEMTFNINAQSATISTSLLSDLNISKVLDLYLMTYTGNEFYKNYTIRYNANTKLLTSIESGKWTDHLYVRYTKSS